jgi:hypothetical protein
MMVMLGSSCSPCCGERIGFDLTDSFRRYSSCFPRFTVVENIATDISKLSQVRLVFAGYNSLNNLCNAQNSVRFAAQDRFTLKSWIENGGRLFFITEFGGCVRDPDSINPFLSDLGSTITWVGGVYDSGCHDLNETPPINRICIPGDANISQNLSVGFKMSATAEIAGGTSVFFSPSGRLVVAVERIGNGFLFVSGDGSISPIQCSGGYATNCEFFMRLHEYDDDDII